MKILLQIGTVFGIYWIGQCIEWLLPVSFPASVISLLLLLLLLLTKVLKAEQVRNFSDFLLGNLAFFFVPVAVGIMSYADAVWENAAAFLIICVFSTVFTFGATAWAVQLTRRWLNKKRGEER